VEPGGGVAEGGFVQQAAEGVGDGVGGDLGGVEGERGAGG
jgi:hypothetical protein